MIGDRINGISDEQHQRLHDAIAQTPNLTDDELANQAGVSVMIARRYRTVIKKRIAEAVETERADSMDLPDYFGTHEQSKRKFTAEDYERLIAEARKERDEWKRRYEVSRSRNGSADESERLTEKEAQIREMQREIDSAILMRDEAVKAYDEIKSTAAETEDKYKALAARYDDLKQVSDYTAYQLQAASQEIDALKRQLDTARIRQTAMPQDTALKLKIADILLERWEAEHHAGALQAQS